jgi:hypothetical protein
MTTVLPCYPQGWPKVSELDSQFGYNDGVCVIAPEMIVRSEVATCLRCNAYLDGCLREPTNGFCPDCVTHGKTLKKQQATHVVLVRRYEEMEVS